MKATKYRTLYTLTFAFLFGLTAATAEEITDSRGNRYVVQDENAHEVSLVEASSSAIDTDGKLRLPPTFTQNSVNWTVTAIEPYAFKQSSPDAVVIPYTVNHIKEWGLLGIKQEIDFSECPNPQENATRPILMNVAQFQYGTIKHFYETYEEYEKDPSLGANSVKLPRAGQRLSRLFIGRVINTYDSEGNRHEPVLIDQRLSKLGVGRNVTDITKVIKSGTYDLFLSEESQYDYGWIEHSEVDEIYLLEEKYEFWHTSYNYPEDILGIYLDLVDREDREHSYFYFPMKNKYVIYAPASIADNYADYDNVRVFSMPPTNNNISADVNEDGLVNVGDVSELYEAILEDCDYDYYDINVDGVVNSGDISSVYIAILTPLMVWWK